MSFEYTISNILEEAGVHYKTNARSFILDCPKCGHNDKIYIDKEDGFWICWVCAETDNFKGPNPSYVLHVLTGKPMWEMKAIFDGMANPDPLPWPNKPEGFGVNMNFKEEPPQPLPLSSEMVPIGSPEGIPGRLYLVNRGIPVQIAEEYGIHFWPRYRRIIFPILVDGVCYGYQARMIDPAGPGDIKILSSKDLPRRSMVMFHHRLKGAPHEGPTDAIKCHLLGGNVATMGKYVTAQQLQAIKSMGVKKIYFALDRDALPGVPDLARDCGLEAYVIRVPDHRGDMGDCTPLEVLEQFKVAERVTGNSLFVYWAEDDPKNKKGS
jgi:hypothetical protein